ISVQVIDHHRAALFEYLKIQMNKNPGLSVALSQGEIEVQGYLHSFDNWKNILNGRFFESTYLMKARFSSDLKSQLQKIIDQDLAAQGLLSI
ncbi:hypothetical protein NL317_28390, partial [Klebsiella pneumoniae]|nr:hypothetical protein [Klebsiella pneumoniae]